jgi:hypothetical protein
VPDLTRLPQRAGKEEMRTSHRLPLPISTIATPVREVSVSLSRRMFYGMVVYGIAGHCAATMPYEESTVAYPFRRYLDIGIM